MVCVPLGFLVTALAGVLPIASLNATSLPLRYALVGQHQTSTTVLAPASSQAASFVGMAVRVAVLLAWWWGAPRLLRGYALLSRRLLGVAATTALTSRVGQLLAGRAAAQPGRSTKLGRLTPREREVLALVAEGRTKAAVAARLFITEKAVDKHLTSVFRKLDLAVSSEDNRRVLAALAYLQQ